MLPEGGDQRCWVDAIFAAHHLAAMAEVLLHQGKGALRGNGDAEISRSPEESPHHRRIGVQQGAVKVPEGVADPSEGQAAGHTHIRRTKGIAQQLPWRDEPCGLMLGQDGQRMGLCGQKGEADVPVGPGGDLLHLGDGEGELLL